MYLWGINNKLLIAMKNRNCNFDKSSSTENLNLLNVIYINVFEKS